MSQCRVMRKGLVRKSSLFLPLIFCRFLVSSNFCFTAAACKCCCFFFSLSFPHYVTPTERERQTDKKNVFPAPNAHDDEPGAPVSLEQGKKPRRAEKAKTPSRGTIGVEIRDFGRGVERKKKCTRRRRSFATTTSKVERKRADLRAIRQRERRRRCS